MKIGDLEIQVERKNIKNTHLSVFPPDGRVHISCPLYLTDHDILSYAISKLDWITKQREIILAQSRQTKREYVAGENHYLFGNRYILNVQESEGKSSVEINNINMVLKIKPGSGEENRHEILKKFYKKELEQKIYEYMEKWLPVIVGEPVEWKIRFMKTRWGTCCPEKYSVLFNLELARVPLNCVEYVVVHELVHFKERHHNDNFKAIMSSYLPDWEKTRKQMNDFVATYIGI